MPRLLDMAPLALRPSAPSSDGLYVLRLPLLANLRPNKRPLGVRGSTPTSLTETLRPSLLVKFACFILTSLGPRARVPSPLLVAPKVPVPVAYAPGRVLYQTLRPGHGPRASRPRLFRRPKALLAGQLPVREISVATCLSRRRRRRRKPKQVSARPDRPVELLLRRFIRLSLYTRRDRPGKA